MFISRAVMESMEQAERAHSRRRSGDGGPRRMNRSASNHSSSSTSSDILVAPGPPSSTPSKPTVPGPSPSRSMAKGAVTAGVADNSLLIVRFTGDKNLAFLEQLAADDARREKHQLDHSLYATSDDPTRIKSDANDDDADGPNHRGTYSKAYTLQHPEIRWQHRGQGRYLPMGRGGRPSNLIRSQSSLSATAGYLKAPRNSLDTLDNHLNRPTPQRRRGSWAATEESPKLFLRRRITGAQTKDEDTDDSRSAARSSRRARAAPSTESERRSSRITTTQSYVEDDEDDDSDMAGDKETTFDKEYVDAHPGEKFYHTGNGWYKKGERPKGRLHAKRRDSEGHALKRNSDGSFEFDAASSIHVGQLGLYPGIEFHHCGNGWYKPGPDPNGRRTSRIGGDSELENEIEAESDDEDVDPEDPDAVVSKSYALKHPEGNWVHRGNGRYKRAGAVKSTPASESYASQEPERDTAIYSKAYVLAHPGEEFHHRGNAKYMRGPPPEHWGINRNRRRSAPTLAGPIDDGNLYSKAYVDAHPNEQFHHRGQGRYARGPRKQPSMEDSTNNSDIDADGLVDTGYVDAHPNETFHHRGQGRWARGMPPAGASNKVAIRGPGARDKSDSGAYLEDEEDEGEKPPALTALVVRSEGPDKFPHLSWHYRGGGKWGRVSKTEFEDIQRGTTRKPRGRARARNADGPEAQLAREAAEAAGRGDEDDADDMNLSPDRPKIKRRRRAKDGVYSTLKDNGDISKLSSQSHSQAPTPKPRMLEPHEDILAEEDLPSLYRGDDRDWTPSASADDDEDDQAETLLRNIYRPITNPDKFVKGLSKHDPAVRRLENLKVLADNAQRALDAIQREYVQLEAITAPHARIPRKPHKGGRAPVDAQIFEDRKEADLYDYNYDPRKVGYQDPVAQRIQRDAEGRELRNRRNRSGATNGTLPGWNFGDDENLGSKRAVKPVHRFDGIVNPPRKRARNSATTTGRNSKAPSMTPDRAGTPLGGPVRNSYLTTTRLTGNVPKRVRELRDDLPSTTIPLAASGGPRGGRGSAASRAASPGSREASPGGTVRKGRPPGSKNLHKRKDAGIKKGPRKPKIIDSIETPGASEAEGTEVEGEVDGDGEGEGEELVL